MSISSVSELEASLIILLDQTPLQVDREGIREREDGERGGESAYIRGKRLSSIFNFRLRGVIDSRGAINRGTATIRFTL